MTMRLLLQLMLAASDLSGYPVPDVLPQMSVLAPAAMPCTCAGQYFDGRISINASLDLGTPFGRSVVVHELTHHLQAVEKGKARDERTRFAREVEAHDVQNRYLASQGSPTRALFTHRTD